MSKQLKSNEKLIVLLNKASIKEIKEIKKVKKAIIKIYYLSILFTVKDDTHNRQR